MRAAWKVLWVVAIASCNPPAQGARGAEPKAAEDDGATARTRTQLDRIATGTNLWRSRRKEKGACPASVDDVKAGRALDPFVESSDAWGQPVRITCTTEETTVVSAGPDGQPGTPDDLRVTLKAPPPAPKHGPEDEHAPDFHYLAADAGPPPDLPEDELTPAQKIARRYTQSARSCFNQALAKDPSLSGDPEIDAELIVAPDGRISNVVVRELGPERLKPVLQCALDGLKGLMLVGIGREQKLRFHVP